MSRSLKLLAAGLLAISAQAQADSDALRSAGALAFNDANVLFVGDSVAGQVHAFDLSDLDDQSAYQLGRAQTFEGRTIINGLDLDIAELLGVAADEIVINDMVVHKPTRQILPLCDQLGREEFCPSRLRAGYGLSVRHCSMSKQCLMHF